MASSVDELTTALSLTKVSESGVSFAGKSLKLDTEEDAKQVIDEIEKCGSLQYLNMEGNTLGVAAAKAIGKSLELHPEFKRALWKDMFTGRMKTEIPGALEFLGDGLVKAGSRLTELDMSDNAFGPVGVKGLAALIKSASCFALEELRLNNNGLGVTGARLLALALTDCYNKSKSEGKPLKLRVFVAGRNRLENEGSKALAEVFKMIGTLEEVTVPQNGIYYNGISALSEAFACNKNLKILNLNDNTIGPKGAKSLAKVLPELQNLEELNVGDCLLKTKGAMILANALKPDHQNLERLIMSFNEIKKSGAQAVAQAMSNKPKLKTVNLDGNQFGDEGCDEVKEMFKTAGKSEALESLSDDEDDDGEEEKEDESEESEEEEIDSDDNSRATTFDEFIHDPTPENFLNLGHRRKEVILNQAKYCRKVSLNEYVAVIMKVSSLYGCDKVSVKEEALEITEELYREGFEWALNEENSPYVLNAIFVGLGMIKNEDKKFTPAWDCTVCQKALKEIIDREHFPKIPKIVRSILNVLFPIVGTRY